MASFNFYLKGGKDTPEFRKSTKPALVSLFVSYNGKRPAFATGISVLPSTWDFKNQRLKSSAANSASLNSHLQGFREMVEGKLAELSKGGILPSPEMLKESILGEKQKVTRNPSLGEVFGDYMDARKDTFAPSTIRSLKRNQTRILNFEKSKGRKLYLEGIKTRDIESLVSYLQESSNHAKNTIADLIKTVKTVLKWAKEEGMANEMEMPKLQVSWEDVPNVYLNEVELQHLFQMDLSQSPKLDRVRDLFLIGCWTGLRFSDFTNLKPENISGNTAKIRTQKTGQIVTIPIHPVVKSILEKYSGEIPPAISNQKMNDYLKDLCKLALFEDRSIESITRGGKKESSFKPKWEMVSTHTARRSFATNQYKAGFPSILLMKITGHQTEKAFLKYIKVDQEEASEKLAEMWLERHSGTFKIA